MYVRMLVFQMLHEHEIVIFVEGLDGESPRRVLDGGGIGPGRRR
ncbi:MAG: hypothetical protein WBO09_19115 [Methylocystis silviterrae]|jgi:hypothetical protein